MHSNIYQIGNKPIDKEDYQSPETYYDNSGDFADYIGDEFEGEEREEAIGYLADLLKDVFEYKGGGEFRYKGKEAMEEFKQAWVAGIKAMADKLTADNLFKNYLLFNLRCITEETHLGTSYRVDIAGWAEGAAYPFGELFKYAASQLKEGDRIYVGAIIDYHY